MRSASGIYHPIFRDATSMRCLLGNSGRYTVNRFIYGRVLCVIVGSIKVFFPRSIDALPLLYMRRGKHGSSVLTIRLLVSVDLTI